MTEPAEAMAYEPTEPLTLTNVIGIATGEPIAPPAKPKRKYTRKAKPRAKRASKVNAAIMPNPSIGVSTLKDGQAGDAISAWSPPVPPPSLRRSIYDILPGSTDGNQWARIFNRSERFWLSLLVALFVSVGTVGAFYWW